MAHLPWDPAISEFWLIFLGFISLIVLIISLVGSVLFWKIYKPPRVWFGLVVILAAPAISTIGSRHFGEWAELKKLLVEYELVVKKYEEKNGKIATFEQKQRFYSQYPRPQFKFSGSDMVIYVSYLEWISSEHKMGLSWDSGANAAFELNTMFCVYSD